MNTLRLKELKDMKTKYLMILMTLAVVVFTFSGCSSNDEPFITASEEDYPRILDPYFPDWNNGQPGEFKNFTRDINLTAKVIVTPVEYTTVTWYLDGQEVATGDSIDMPLLAGTYVLKVVARTTKGLETSRTGLVVVRPCEGDPVPGDLLFDRLVVPGTVATLHGENMDKVKQVIINGVAATATYHSEGDYVTYTVPNLADGSYQLPVADATGFVYGGGTITVSSAPIINGNAFSGKANGEVTIEGQNLDKTASITIGGKAATIVSKVATSLTFKAPELEPGDYDMTATDASGKAVKFIAGSEFVEKATFNVTTETVLWEGAWQVTWGTPFNALQSSMPSMVHAGNTVRVYVSGNGQGTMTTAWWNNILTGEGDPNRGDIMISGDMVLEYLLTDYSMELMNSQDGVLIVGDGYTVLKVTVE